jgi:ribonuclease-3
MTDEELVLCAAEEALGVTFRRRALLRTALTHSSFAAEYENTAVYERMEFLGDAVLGFVVAEHLYRSFPDYDEGRLSRVRRDLVNGKALATVADDIGLGPLILVGRSADLRGERLPQSIMADAMEAVIGAVYLDRGMAEARRFVLRVLTPALVSGVVESAAPDYKTRLQEHTMPQLGELPRYVIVGDEGPDHDKIFHAEVHVAGRRWGGGTGPSKRAAEQEAAREAWETHVAVESASPPEVTGRTRRRAAGAGR